VTLGDYDVGPEIGSGGSATVYRARHRGSGTMVALKIWHDPLDAQGRVRFEREIDALRAVAGGRSVVQLYAWAAPGEPRAWIATELCDESLVDLCRRGSLSAAAAFALADDILAGLVAIHESRHLHRDIKPENVLLKAGRAKLCDLGITMPVDNVTRHNIAGTGPYLAPELATGQPTVRSDLYAAALVIDAMFPEDRPDAVTKLLVRASSARPVDRPSSAADFRAALAALRPTSAPARLRPPTTTPELSPSAAPEFDPAVAPEVLRRSPGVAARSRRRTRLLAIGGITLAVAVAATVPRLIHPASGQGPDVGHSAVGTVAAPANSHSAPSSGSHSAPSSGPSQRSAVATSPVTHAGNPAATASGASTPTTGASTTGASHAPTSRAVDSAGCFATAVSGGLDISAGSTAAGGPNFLDQACRDIHLKLTAATAPTQARSCVETADGNTTLSCSGWVQLRKLGDWYTLSTGVAPGSRYRLEMRSDSAERADFLFTG
jgi:serine/threonine protein kinase